MIGFSFKKAVSSSAPIECLFDEISFAFALSLDLESSFILSALAFPIWWKHHHCISDASLCASNNSLLAHQITNGLLGSMLSGLLICMMTADTPLRPLKLALIQVVASFASSQGPNTTTPTSLFINAIHMSVASFESNLSDQSLHLILLMELSREEAWRKVILHRRLRDGHDPHHRFVLTVRGVP
jgi:hypothetical protein